MIFFLSQLTQQVELTMKKLTAYLVQLVVERVLQKKTISLKIRGSSLAQITIIE